MWTIKEARLRNFMSYEDQVVVFKEREATIIQGVNLSNEGFENNGAGKSAILEGIVVCIANLSLRKQTTPKDLIRRGEVECNLDVKLFNSVTKDVLDIERAFFSNTKSSTLKISINQVHQKDIISVKDGDKFILDKLDISKEDLLNYYLVSSEKFESFFSISDTAKKSLIGRFSNSNIIDIVVEKLKVGLDKLNTQSRTKQDQIIGSTSTIESYEELIKEKTEETPETKEGFKSKIQEKILQTKNEAKQHLALVTSSTLLQTEVAVKETDVQKEIDALETKRKKYKDDSDEFEIEYRKLKKNRDETENIQKQLEAKLISSVECPECQFTFNPNSKEKVDVKQISSNIEIAKKYVVELNDKMAKIAVKETALSTKLSLLKTELLKKEQEKRGFTTERNRLDGVISTSNTKIQTCDNLVLELTKSVNSFQEVDLSAIIRDLRKKSDEESVKKEAYSKERVIIEGRIEKTTYWIISFTRFKTHLSNKVIKVIECFINEYLGRMATDVRIQIEGYKMNKDNTIKESISVALHRDGEDASFSTYSNGERARVEIAAIFAIQKLINSSIQDKSSTGGLEFTFLDEIIDSVDSLGMFNIMKTLQTLDRTVSVISHVAFKEHSEDLFNTVTVEKENKISIIK